MDLLQEQFSNDGVLVVRDLLDAQAMAAAERAFDWSVTNEGPNHRYYESGGATFFQDVSNPGALPHYADLLRVPAIANLASRVWGGSRVWFMFEQIFLKEGGESRRTPWHQDSSYMAVRGQKLGVMWINLDPVSPEDSLEFIRGSHRGPTYNGSSFDPNDDTDPSFITDELPRLPNIESDRSKWDIVSWGVNPGDVVLFHPAILHGGAPTHVGKRRRTLTIRLFGDDVVYRPLPWDLADGLEAGGASPKVPGLSSLLAAGDALRHPVFPQLDPEAGVLRATDWLD